MFTFCRNIDGPGFLAWKRISMPWSGWMWNMRRFDSKLAAAGVSRKITWGTFLNWTTISVPRFQSALPERR